MAANCPADRRGPDQGKRAGEVQGCALMDAEVALKTQYLRGGSSETVVVKDTPCDYLKE